MRQFYGHESVECKKMIGVAFWETLLGWMDGWIYIFSNLVQEEKTRSRVYHFSTVMPESVGCKCCSTLLAYSGGNHVVRLSDNCSHWGVCVTACYRRDAPVLLKLFSLK